MNDTRSKRDTVNCNLVDFNDLSVFDNELSQVW